MNRRGQIGPLAVLAMMGSVGGIPAVQMEAQRMRERAELVMRARLLGVKNPEIHSSRDLEAEIAAQLSGPGLTTPFPRMFNAVEPPPRRPDGNRSLSEKKARRAKRKQRRQR